MYTVQIHYCCNYAACWNTFRNQSIYSNFFHTFVPIIDTIRSLFLRDDFSRAFQNGGSRNSHKCTNGEYSEYCCGSAFKKSEIFQAHPESLQILIATDDFEVCNPLSSKASLHKICAIYFVIRNMPRLSYLSNIYLICLCNSNDIRTKTPTAIIYGNWLLRNWNLLKSFE